MFLLVGEQLTGSSAVGKHICVPSFLLLVVLCLVIHIPHCSLQSKTYNRKGWNWNTLTHAASRHFTRHILHWSRLLKLNILSLQLPSFWSSLYSEMYFYVTPSHSAGFVPVLQVMKQNCGFPVQLQFSSGRVHRSLSQLHLREKKWKKKRIKG